MFGPIAPGRSVLPALIVGQIGLHSAMAGLRLAAPLQALRDGRGVAPVGFLMALFALLPVLSAIQAGRYADRRGYHAPVRLAVALVMAGVGCALLAMGLAGGCRFGAQCVGAALCGAGANVGLIAIQRSAGRLCSDATDRLRVFSWLSLAPAIANIVGPVGAGLMIDAGGFGAAYVFLLALPLASMAATRWVPADTGPSAAVAASANAALSTPPPTAWSLLATPGFRRLLVVNALLSASWDMHSFAVPVLGHERGFSASVIGLVLGGFTAAVTAVRVAVPMLAHRLSEVVVLRWAMLATALVFAVYPLVGSAWAMAACAVLLGLPLGTVQPMVMSMLHRMTPEDRAGEAIALRSMTINTAGSVMPMAFGAAGAAVGPAALFWVMGLAVGLGNWAVPTVADATRAPPAPAA
jgi:MFS family permease